MLGYHTCLLGCLPTAKEDRNSHIAGTLAPRPLKRGNPISLSSDLHKQTHRVNLARIYTRLTDVTSIGERQTHRTTHSRFIAFMSMFIVQYVIYVHYDFDALMVGPRQTCLVDCA